MKQPLFYTLRRVLTLFTGWFSVRKNGSTDTHTTQQQANRRHPLRFEITDDNAAEVLPEDRRQAAFGVLETVDIDDELTAELRIEPSVIPRKRLFRAARAERYTICAYDMQGRQVPGWMTGTLKRGSFRPDTGAATLQLEDHRHYLLVCHNTGVDNNGQALTVSIANAPHAKIDVLHLRITASTRTVHFHVKHVAARVHTHLTAYMPLPRGIRAMVTPLQRERIPASVQLDVCTGRFTPVFGSDYRSDYSYPPSKPCGAQMPCLHSTTSREACYLLPETDAAQLHLTFLSGALYGTPLNSHKGKAFRFKAPFVLSANHSYTVRIVLKPRFRYLFADGTTGFFTDGMSTHDCIGVVIREKTAQQHGLAIALHHLGGNEKMTWTAAMRATDTPEQVPCDSLHEALQRHTVLSDANPAALCCSPRCFLPSLGDWYAAYRTLGLGGEVTPLNALHASWNGAMAHLAFERVSGTPLYRHACWSGTSLERGDIYHVVASRHHVSFAHKGARKEARLYVRPFYAF